jgi:hypothetical protein
LKLLFADDFELQVAATRLGDGDAFFWAVMDDMGIRSLFLAALQSRHGSIDGADVWKEVGSSN